MELPRLSLRSFVRLSFVVCRLCYAMLCYVMLHTSCRRSSIVVVIEDVNRSYRIAYRLPLTAFRVRRRQRCTHVDFISHFYLFIYFLLLRWNILRGREYSNRTPWSRCSLPVARCPLPLFCVGPRVAGFRQVIYIYMHCSSRLLLQMLKC